MRQDEPLEDEASPPQLLRGAAAAEDISRRGYSVAEPDAERRADAVARIAAQRRSLLEAGATLTPAAIIEARDSARR